MYYIIFTFSSSLVESVISQFFMPEVYEKFIFFFILCFCEQGDDLLNFTHFPEHTTGRLNVKFLKKNLLNSVRRKKKFSIILLL